jgi:hypothetical protein
MVETGGVGCDCNDCTVQAQWDQRARVESDSIEQSWAVTAGVTVRPADEEEKENEKKWS